MDDPELGYREIAVDRPDDPLFEEVPETFTAFTCHEDAVLAPPDDATVLASNERGVQALRRGRIASVKLPPRSNSTTRAASSPRWARRTTRPPRRSKRSPRSATGTRSWAVFRNFVEEARHRSDNG